MDIKRHEVIDDLQLTVENAINSVLKDSEATAEIVSAEVASTFSKKWAGMSVYFPQDLNYEISSRNVQIYNEFTSGATHAQLVQKYKISLQHVYSVIKKVREELRKKNQGDLFNETDA